MRPGASTVVSQGGIRFEYRADVAEDRFHWRAAMRSHSGFGATLADAVDDLLGQINAELKTASDCRAGLRAAKS